MNTQIPTFREQLEGAKGKPLIEQIENIKNLYKTCLDKFMIEFCHKASISVANIKKEDIEIIPFLYYHGLERPEGFESDLPEYTYGFCNTPEKMAEINQRKLSFQPQEYLNKTLDDLKSISTEPNPEQKTRLVDANTSKSLYNIFKKINQDKWTFQDLANYYTEEMLFDCLFKNNIKEFKEFIELLDRVGLKLREEGV